MQPPFPKFKEKCVKAWNAHNRIPRVAHAIKSRFGRYLVTPVATRWNSLFEGIQRLLEIMREDDGEGMEDLNQIFLQQVDKAKERPTFIKRDMDIADEYCRVMIVPCRALDDVQRDKFCHAGLLLPRLRGVKHHFATQLKMGRTDENNQEYFPGTQVYSYCTELLEHLEERFMFRFGYLFEDEDLLLATMLHPNFKYRWTKACLIHEDSEAAKEVKMTELKNKIVNDVYQKQVAEQRRQQTGEVEPEPVKISPPKAAAASLSFLSEMAGLVEARPAEPEADALKTIVDDEFTRWVKGPETTEVPRPHHLPSDPVRGKFYIDLFMKYNTALPSSASVERVFSVAGDVLRAKRNRLSGEHVNRLIFIKQNAPILKTCRSFHD